MVDRFRRAKLTARVKYSLPMLLLASLWMNGCATKNSPPNAPLTKSSTDGTPATAALLARKTNSVDQLIVTPESTVTGRVMAYNEAGRFVVLDFPIGHLPAHEQTLFVFRQGLKVGAVKVTGPQRDHHTVADLVSGEAQKGDEIRER